MPSKYSVWFEGIDQAWASCAKVISVSSSII